MNFRKFGKYICTVALAAVMSVTTMGAVTISDVSNSHWAYSAITDLADRGIMVLTSNGQFYPNQTMSYFEVADVIAKASGYVDVDIATNITDTFKAQVKKNYENQKATLASYAAKYSTWNKAYDQQIAYLLGRGYMTKSDLDKFITKTAQGETKNTVTKEQLAVYIVRLLEREKTATSTYKTTTFKDDSQLTAAYKPYVEYLKTVGIINPDSAGKANGTMKVTKALCAKMLSETLKIKDTTTIGKAPNTTTNNPANGTTNNTTSNTTANTGSGTYTISSIITKSTNEYYILLNDGKGNTKHYSFKTTTKIYDATGAEMALANLAIGTTVDVTVQNENNTNYITSMKVSSSTGTNTGVNTNTNTGTNTNTNINTGVNTNTNTGSGTNTTQGTTVSGTLLTDVVNEVLRLTLTDGSSAVYLVNDHCKVTLDGVMQTSTDSLDAGDLVVITLENNAVTQITATSGKGNVAQNNTASTLTKGEVKAKKFAGNNYVFTIKDGNVEQQITVPSSTKARRNNKSVKLADIRVGDTVALTRTGHTVSMIEATGVKSKVEGIIKALYISATPHIVLDVDGEEVNYALASNAEVYDNNLNEYISVKDLHLGQEVTILLESREIISIDVDKTSGSYKLMGTITDIGKNDSYMEVLVDYDYASGQSKVYKRIELTSDVPVIIDGKTKTRSALDEDMQVVINYKYFDDKVPEKILVL
ncbi:MAG: S-layer homology domain-containing protein [Cellulosilyticum sp.]|nr:S-layer homology domain-containing protein [Cellulosilyticum sp.]